MLEYSVEGVLELPDQVGSGDGSTSAYAGYAMNQDVCLFSSSFDELVGMGEVLAQVVGLVVVCWEVEVDGNFLLVKIDLSSSRDGQNGLDVVFFIKRRVLFSKETFLAAWMVEM